MGTLPGCRRAGPGWRDTPGHTQHRRCRIDRLCFLDPFTAGNQP